MKYNFDAVVDRRGTDAVKLESLQEIWGRTDLMPMWIADMDLPTPDFVTRELHHCMENPVLGYTAKPQQWYDAVRSWVKRRYDWNVAQSQITYSPGIVPGLAFSLRCFTEVGDKVMIQPPVYHPFANVIRCNNRQIVNSPLILENGQYRMDIESLRTKIKGCKMFILCNPHNPGGVVWTREELAEVAHICAQNGTVVVSDEIHADLTLPPYHHTPFAKISEEARMNCVTYMSSSKSFNMAGLASSYCIIENPQMLERHKQAIEACEYDLGHIFAFRGLVAAYTYGEEWLSQLLDYLNGNIDYVCNFLKTNCPKIEPIRPQASFLVLLDCRKLGFDVKGVNDFFVRAGLALNDGAMFGHEGEGFMRMNIGTPRVVLQQAMSQLAAEYNKL